MTVLSTKTENGAGALVTPNQSYTFDKTLWVIADQANADVAQAPKYVKLTASLCHRVPLMTLS